MFNEHSIFQGLSSKDKETLAQHTCKETFSPNEFIIHQGAKTKDLFIIESGHVQVLQHQENKHEQANVISELQSQDIIGEMAFIAETERTTDVKAIDEVEILRIPFSIRNACVEIYHKLVGNIIRIVIERIKTSNQKQVELQEAKIKQLPERLHLARFFVTFLMIFAIVLVTNYLLENYWHFNAHSPLFTNLYLIVIAIPMFTLIYINHQPLSIMGFSKVNIKKSIIEGILWTILCLIIITAYKWSILSYHHTSIHSFSQFYQFKIYVSFYIISVFIQQAIRTLFQNIVYKMFLERNHFMSILLSSFIFGLFHIHFGFIAIGVTFLVSVLFALLYLRHKNIYGICIIHFCAGAAAFASGLI